MPLSETVLIIAGLLTVAMTAAGLCRKLPIPFTVVLVVIGVVLGAVADRWAVLAPLATFRLSPDVVFFLFLPALIFESGFNLDARQLIKDLAPVLVLAVPALMISTAVVGAGLWIVLDMDLSVALLFGALISATDPVAVVALFKELGAPLRLTVLVEGESLLNDATAIVLFGILLEIAVGGGGLSWLGAGFAVLDFVWVFVGGTVVGVVLGLFVSELLFRTRSGVSAILTMSMVLAYAAFVLAEHVLHVSGVMAAAAAAVTLGVLGVTRMPQAAADAIGETWELIALICNSLLFILVGLSIDPAALVSRSLPIALAVTLVLAARAATVASLVPLTTRVFSLPTITPGERCVMWWGGLKGGLAIAIVLLIPETLPARALLLDMTLGVVLFTLLVNAPTIRPLMRRLRLDRLTDDERVDLKQTMVAAGAEAEHTLGHLAEAGVITRAIRQRVGHGIRKALESDAPRVRREQRTRHAYVSALRVELTELSRLRGLGLVSQYNFLDMRGALRRDQEAHLGDRPTFDKAAVGAESPFLRFEMALLRRLREVDWAAPALAAYQNLRLAQRLQRDIAGVLMCTAVLEMLDARSDLDAEQREDVAGAYARRLEHRRARVDTLRREFPEFFQRFESGMCHRVGLISASAVVRRRHHDGEIGTKAFAHLERLIEGKIAALAPISAALPRATAKELISVVPLFSGLLESTLESLAAQARAVTALPGDIIIGEGEKGDALYIVTHGELDAVKHTEDGKEHPLGRLVEGDFFGETALLGDHVRTATVRARTPSTLLRITRRDVLKLAGEHPEIERSLKAASDTRTPIV